MVEQFFASLSKRQTMLLLTAVTFGGNESVDAFDHLPDEEKEILKHRAKGLLEIPRDKRIPVLVQEIKRLITARRRQLGSADPAQLAKVLSGERAAMVEVVLRALPATLADAVRKDLPPQRAPVKLKREVRQDVLSIIRWKLEDALKQSQPQIGLFKFSDLLTLQQRELLTICDRMGARALATAFAGLPDEDAQKLFGAMPPDQKSLAQRATEAGKSRKLTEADSRTVLEIYGAGENPSAGMRSAGAQRLARACIAQSQEFAIKLIDRHPGELGKLLTKWVKEERHRPLRGDGGRADIVEQMERLAQRGVIDKPMRLPPPPMAKVSVSQHNVLAPVPQRKSVVAPLNPLMASQQRAANDRERAERGEARERGERNERNERNERGGPVPDRERGPSRRTGPRPRRDFMAERNARAAGAASSRVQNSKVGTDPRLDPRNLPQARVLRDGKPIEKASDSPTPLRGGKAMTSPALQEIPRRRDKNQGARVVSGLYKSPVVKGPKPGSDE